MIIFDFFNEDEDSEVVILHRSQYQELLVEYANALAPYMPSSR